MRKIMDMVYENFHWENGKKKFIMEQSFINFMVKAVLILLVSTDCSHLPVTINRSKNLSPGTLLCPSRSNSTHLIK